MVQRHLSILPHYVRFGGNAPAGHKYTVSYEKYPTWTIAERYNWGNWQHRVLVGPSGVDFESKGSYEGSLGAAGHVYEALVLPYVLDDRDFGPTLDAKEAETLWETRLFYDCAVGVAERTKLIADWGVPFGGTWIDPVAYTTEAATILISVGTAQPVAKPGAPHEFVSNDYVVDRSVHHGATSAGTHTRYLYPGHDYWILIVAVRPDGAWDEVVQQVTLKRRTLEVAATKIHVINDGDPGGSGECDFSFSFLEGNPELSGGYESEILLGSLPERDVTDGEDIQLQDVYASGPSMSERSYLKVIAGGTDHDGWLEDDEQALGIDQIDYPSGPSSEEFSRSITLVAYPLNGDFTFTLFYDVKVAYTT